MRQQQLDTEGQEGHNREEAVGGPTNSASPGNCGVQCCYNCHIISQDVLSTCYAALPAAPKIQDSEIYRNVQSLLHCIMDFPACCSLSLP